MTSLVALAHVAGERMLNSVIAGFLLTMLAWALLRLLPRTDARTRMAVWLCVLFAVPALSVAALFSNADSALLFATSPHVVVPEAWAFYGLLFWLGISGVALLRVAIGVFRIRRMRQSCRRIDIAALPTAVAETVNRFRPKRTVSLLISDTARVPVAVGFLRPAVILPSWALSELSSAELSAVLVHEFAHLRRWDDWTNLLQKVLRALFFFHPALWWVDRRLALEREMACDDVVIAATHDAHAYATCLVDIAEKSLLRRSLALAQAAVHGVGHMSLRVTEILDSSRPRTTRTSKLALGGTAMLAIASLAAVVNSPTLISLTASKPAVEDARSSTDIPAIAPGFDNARVTPVAFHQEVRHPRPAPKRQLAARRVQPKAFVAALNANSLAQQGNRGKLQEASWAAQSAAVPVETMLVLMPDVRFDSTGRVLCTWSLWRLTVFQPAQAMVEDTRIPKSI